MFCAYCGKEIPDNSEFCSYCGKQISVEKSDFKADTDTVQDNNVTHNSTMATHPYQSMGGWLAFFTYSWLIAGICCILLIILQLLSLTTLNFKAGSYLGNVIGQAVGIGTLIMVVCYSIYAALCFNLHSKMKDKDTGFLHFYESMWIFTFLFYIASCFFPYITNPTLLKYIGTYMPSMLLSMLKTVVGPLIGFILTMLYFSKSVRVRTYFGTDEYLRKSRFLASTPSPQSMVPGDNVNSVGSSSTMSEYDAAVAKDSKENMGRFLKLLSIVVVAIAIIMIVSLVSNEAKKNSNTAKTNNVGNTNNIVNNNALKGNTIKLKDEINDALYYGTGVTYGELKSRFGNLTKNLYEKIWYVESSSMNYKYAFTQWKNRELEDDDRPKYIWGKLGDFFDGLNRTVTIEDFVGLLRGCNGSYRQNNGIIWYQTSSIYYSIGFNCNKLHVTNEHEGKEYGAQLCIVVENGQNTVSPDSYARLMVAAG